MSPLQAADHYVRHAECNRELMERAMGCEVRNREDESLGTICTWENAYRTIQILTDTNRIYSYDKYGENVWTVLGRSPQLQNYLKVLREVLGKPAKFNLATLQDILEIEDSGYYIQFDLDTGAPATDDDARKFLELCGVEVSN